MSEGSAGYHEPYGELSESTREMHRAIVSVTEELEAIDWYQQRVDACRDEALAKVLRHNLEEEIEHALMGLEWIRTNLPAFDRAARAILFGGAPPTRGDASLGVGDAGKERSWTS